MRSKTLRLTQGSDEVVDPNEFDHYDLILDGAISCHLAPARDPFKELYIRILPQRKQPGLFNDNGNSGRLSFFTHSASWHDERNNGDTRIVFPDGHSLETLDFDGFTRVEMAEDLSGPVLVPNSRAPAFIRLQWTGRDWMVIAASNGWQRPGQPPFSTPARVANEGEQQAEAQTEAQPS